MSEKIAHFPKKCSKDYVNMAVLRNIVVLRNISKYLIDNETIAFFS